jgi:hypothetical protein
MRACQGWGSVREMVRFASSWVEVGQRVLVGEEGRDLQELLSP